MLLSICIPTRNREHYICEVVQGLLRQFPIEIEVVVSDNSDDINKFLVDLAKNNKRLNYIYKKGEVSFADNFECAVVAAKGEYVTTIGDDDYVVPEIIDAVIYAKNEKTDTIIYNLRYVYYWPGINGRTNESSGALRIAQADSSNICVTIDQQSELKKFLESGMSEFENSNLSRIYHGVVSKSLVEIVIRQYGKLFGGLSPDIYSSIMLSATAEKTLKWPRALTIPGVCRMSGSGQSAQGKHRGKLKDAPHFRGNIDYSWENEIPKYYSVDTIWAESAIKAIKILGKFEIMNINFNKLYAKSIINNLSIAGIALASSRSASANVSSFLILWSLFEFASRKLLNKVKKKNYKIISAPNTILDISDSLN